MTIDVAKIKTIIKVKEIKGTSFVGVRNYENRQGEVSNQTFVVGINYHKLLQNDLDTLGNFNINAIVKKYPNERLIVLQAYKELLASLIKRTATEKEKQALREQGDVTMRRSDAQRDAYFHVGKGLRAKDQNLYLFGLMVKKTVLVKVDYPSTNSRIKTIIKADIKRSANLRELKVKNFKLGNLETLKVQGATINKEVYDI